MLALTFLQAPFQHFHEQEENEHHPLAGFFHVHFHHQHPVSSKAEISGISPDDDAVYQSWYADASHDLIVPAYLPINVCDPAVNETSEPYIDRNPPFGVPLILITNGLAFRVLLLATGFVFKRKDAGPEHAFKRHAYQSIHSCRPMASNKGLLWLPKKSSNPLDHAQKPY